MKKLFYVLSFWIAFFLGGIFYTLTVKANALPIHPGTFEVITNTATQMLDLGYVPQSLSPYSPISTKNWTPWNAGAALLSFDINDCVTTELSQAEKNELFSTYTVVDTSNVEISVDSPIYCVKMDNGYFTGYCYVDDTGKLLSYSNDLGGQLMQIKYGGSVKTSEDWQDFYEETATAIYSSNMVYYDGYQNGSLPDVSYYVLGGLKSGGDPYVLELYIPNQYEKGVCVPKTWYSNGEIYEWYCNGTPYQFRQVWGNTHDTSYSFQVTAGTYTYDGVSYTRIIRRNFGTGAPNNTYENWISGADRNHYTLAHSGYIYNSNTASTVANDETTAFKPLQLPESAEIINYNYYYDPTAISRLESEINNLTQLVNESFNSQQSVSENNFPFYYPATTVQNNPSEIPFPSVQNYPSYVNPLDPDPVQMPDPATAPSIGSDIGEVDPANLRSGIPLINNLLNRFPFSIPWDIYGLLNGLDVPRETPYIHTTVVIPVVEYEWEIDYDLSDFDGTARLFRTLFLISYVIGLAYFSYDHFFGS